MSGERNDWAGRTEAAQRRAAELVADDAAHDVGRCFDCAAMPDEPHTVECDEIEDRRHMQALRDSEVANDFRDWLDT